MTNQKCSGDAADFYTGRGDTAQWHASVSDFGHPQDVSLDGMWSIYPDLNRYSLEDYLGFVSEHARYVKSKGSTAWVKDWPWSHASSLHTPWSYFYDNGTVYVYHFGVEMMLIRCNLHRDDPNPSGARVRRGVTSAFPSMRGEGA